MRSNALSALDAAVAVLAAADLDAAPDTVLADQLIILRRQLDRLEAQWLRRLEAFDRRGGATAHGAVSTGAWLRSACRLSPGLARARVELARALPSLPDTAAALAAGQISAGHAQQVAAAVGELADVVGAAAAAEVEPALIDVARAVDPARLRRELVHARHALAPEAAVSAAERAYERRGLSASETLDGMVAVDGILDPEGGALLLATLMPMSAPAGPDDRRTPRQRRADALTELARQQLDRGDTPMVGGERPHLTVLVPLDTLQPKPPPRPAHSNAGSGTQPSPAGQTTDAPSPVARAAEPAHSPAIGPGPATGSGTQPSPAGQTSDAPSPVTQATKPAHGSAIRPGSATGAPTSPTQAAQAIYGSACHTRPGSATGAATSPTQAAQAIHGSACPTRPDGPTDGAAHPTGPARPTSDCATQPDPGAGTSMPPTQATPAARGTAAWGAAAADTLWAGPIAGDAARRLACDAGITRVITDAASQPLDVGRRTRTIPPAIRTALTVRDRGCAFPHCDRPPPWTDAHHLTAWLDGGPTSLDNLILLCRRHHRAVHEGHWQLTRTPDGRWSAAPPTHSRTPTPMQAA